MSALLQKLKDKKKIVIIVVLLLVAAFVLRGCLGSKKNAASQSSITNQAIERRLIIEDLSGSGSLKPANSYTVTTLVQGEILSADFEEGDIVEADTILYRIDSSDVANNVEKAQIALGQAERSYNNVVDNQYVRSNINGQLYQLKVRLGDEVTAGQQIAVLRDSSTMLLTIPFPADDAKTFYIGQEASVILDGSFEVLSGRVDTVSGSDIFGNGNMITRNVTIAVKNPGALNTTQLAAASINGIAGAGTGTFKFNAESTVSAQSSGTVTEINVKEGGDLSKEQVIVTLGGKNLNNTIQNASDNLRNSQISMESVQNQLENYTVKSPIYGTIVDKQLKAGDNASTGKVMCIIYDLSYLEMSINIDELDINKVYAGQPVTVTADAAEGKTYSGVITKVSLVGSSASGGATVYPATIRIDEFEGLRPGMNADAEIVVAKEENVIAVPNQAISRGNYVLVTENSPSASNKDPEKTAPAGYVYVPVVTGASDQDYTQIRSGLVEGDTIGVPQKNSGTNLYYMFR